MGCKETNTVLVTFILTNSYDNTDKKNMNKSTLSSVHDSDTAVTIFQQPFHKCSHSVDRLILLRHNVTTV